METRVPRAEIHLARATLSTAGASAVLRRQPCDLTRKPPFVGSFRERTVRGARSPSWLYALPRKVGSRARSNRPQKGRPCFSGTQSPVFQKEAALCASPCGRVPGKALGAQVRFPCFRGAGCATSLRNASLLKAHRPCGGSSKTDAAWKGAQCNCRVIQAPPRAVGTPAGAGGSRRTP